MSRQQRVFLWHRSNLIRRRSYAIHPFFLNWSPIILRLSDSKVCENINTYTTRTHAKTSYDIRQPMTTSGVVGSAPHYTIGMHSAKNGTGKNNYLFDRINTKSYDVWDHFFTIICRCCTNLSVPVHTHVTVEYY